MTTIYGEELKLLLGLQVKQFFSYELLYGTIDSELGISFCRASLVGEARKALSDKGMSWAMELDESEFQLMAEEKQPTLWGQELTLLWLPNTTTICYQVNDEWQTRIMPELMPIFYAEFFDWSSWWNERFDQVAIAHPSHVVYEIFGWNVEHQAWEYRHAA